MKYIDVKKTFAKHHYFALSIPAVLLLSACQSETGSSTKQVNTIDRAPYTLTASPFQDEIIEASIGFMAPAVSGLTNYGYQYELNIRNNIRTEFTLKQIEIIDPAKPGEVLKSYSGDALIEIFDRPGLRPRYGNLDLAGNGSGVANINLTLPKNSASKEIYHRLKFSVETGQGPREVSVEVARHELTRPSNLTIGSPFEGGDWAYFTIGHGQTRHLIEGAPIYSQRFALDLAKVGADGGFAKDDTGTNESFYSYGKDLLAVADGTIIAVKDGLPDNDATNGEYAIKITRETGGGNYVLLDIGDGLNAFYAHLIPGSLTVKVGDPVKQGQVLGRLGNSGDSDGPHLHLHIEKSTSLNRPISGEGVPFSFARVTELDRYTRDELEVIFEADTILNRPLDLSIGPDNMFIRNGLLRFE